LDRSRFVVSRLPVAIAKSETKKLNQYDSVGLFKKIGKGIGKAVKGVTKTGVKVVKTGLNNQAGAVIGRTLKGKNSFVGSSYDLNKSVRDGLFGKSAVAGVVAGGSMFSKGLSSPSPGTKNGVFSGLDGRLKDFAKNEASGLISGLGSGLGSGLSNSLKSGVSKYKEILIGVAVVVVSLILYLISRKK